MEDREPTYGEVIQDLKDDAKSIGVRLDFSFNYVTLYHGTSKKGASEIRNSGLFRDGFFFSNTSKSQYGDSVYWYAKNRGEKDGSGPDVMKMNVDPRSFHINVGTSEIESDGDLWLWSDGVWRNRKEEKSENYESKSSKIIMEMFDIKSSSFVQNFAMSMLRYKYYNLKIRDKEKLLSEFKQELRNYLETGEERPRWMTTQAKLWKCENKQEFIENINKFLDIKSLDVLIEDKPIRESRLLKFDQYKRKSSLIIKKKMAGEIHRFL
jgi:hypothetical protein